MTSPIGEKNGYVLHIMIVGFHHKHGPQLEFCHPPIEGHDSSSGQLPEEWKLLPNLALPDGAHNYEEDTVYFVLPSLAKRDRSLFCVSCYRQIDADKLVTKSDDVTRSSVQKAVVAISKVPAFGAVSQQLSQAAQAYFDLRDFSQVHALKDVYSQLNSFVAKDSLTPMLYTGLSIKNLVIRYRQKLLVLFKLLLLERRVLVYMNPVSELTDSLVSLVSLYPNILEDGLDRCGSVVNSKYNIRNVAGTDFVSIEKDADSDASVDDCSDFVRQDSVPPAASAEKQQQQQQQQDGGKEEENKNDNEKDAAADNAAAGAPGGGRLQGAIAGASNLFSSVRTGFMSRVSQQQQQQQQEQQEDYEAEQQEQAADDLQSPFITDDYGFPLPLFAESAVFLPYTSLHQLQLLDEPGVRACLLGASNIVFKDSKQKLDVMIGSDHTDFCINDRALAKQLRLSGADEVFMQFIINKVMPPPTAATTAAATAATTGADAEAGDADAAANAAAQAVANGAATPTESECSDNWLRSQFRIYLLAVLQAAKSDEPDDWYDFNANFVRAMQKTYHFRVWSAHDHRGLAAMDAATVQLHPCHGQSAIAAKFNNLLTNTEQGRKVSSAVQSTGRVIEDTGKAVGGAITNARSAMSGFFTGLSSRASSRFAGGEQQQQQEEEQQGEQQQQQQQQ